MNKVALNCLVLCFSQIVIMHSGVDVVAQQAASPGYIELNSGTVLYGKADHIDDSGVHTSFYRKIRFTDSSGKKRKFKPKDVAAFQVDGTRFEVFWLSQTQDRIALVNPRYDIDPDKGTLHYLKVVSAGSLSHYEYQWWEQGEALMMTMALLKRKEDSYFMRADQGLLGLKRKTLARYFQDCPAMQAEISERRLRNVSEVVDLYNAKCGMKITGLNGLLF